LSFEDHLFGRVAVSLDFVTPETLRANLERLESGDWEGSLADLLLAEGVLDGDRVETVLKLQKKKSCKHFRYGNKEDEEESFAREVLTAGLVSLSELESSFLEKEALARRHLHVHLGEVLINRGLIPGEKVREILRAMRGEIRHCDRCDLNFRIRSRVPEEKWLCPRCGKRLSPVEFLQLIEADGEIE